MYVLVHRCIHTPKYMCVYDIVCMRVIVRIGAVCCSLIPRLPDLFNVSMRKVISDTSVQGFP